MTADTMARGTTLPSNIQTIFTQRVLPLTNPNSAFSSHTATHSHTPHVQTLYYTYLNSRDAMFYALKQHIHIQTHTNSTICLLQTRSAHIHTCKHPNVSARTQVWKHAHAYTCVSIRTRLSTVLGLLFWERLPEGSSGTSGFLYREAVGV